MGNYITKVSRIMAILLLFTLLASGAFAKTNVTHLVGLEKGTNSDIVTQYGTITHEFSLINTVAVILTPEAAAQLAQEPGVKYVEENTEQTLEEPASEPLMQAMGDNFQALNGESPTYPWNLETVGINAVEAWNQFGVQGDGIKIAILGTGVDYTLPDLNEQYLGGYDFGEDDPDPQDPFGYGTHKASIILGKGTTIQGIAPNAQYYALKIWTDAGTTDAFKKVDAVEWAIQNGADIILLDWWDTGGIFPVADLIRNGYSKGILFVGRSGDASIQKYPALYDKLISVGGHNEDQTLLSTTQPHFVSVVAPGDNIEVLQPGGTTTNYTGTAISAAHVVGALALMYDYNRTNDQGYSNEALWDTLNYSAIWLDGQDADKQGNGKADVNAALTWMEQNWFIDKAVNYLNPNEPGDPPVYYYENAFDYEVEVTNNSDETFYNLTIKAKAIYLEGSKQGQDVTEIPVFETTIAQLDPSQLTIVGPSPTILSTSIEPGLKGVFVEVEVGEEGVPLGAVMGFTALSNGWILTSGPEEGILHLTDMPWYEKEETYYSGAATAQMILNFVRQAAGYGVLTQDEIYAYGGGVPANDLDADAMDAVLGHYDPYDDSVSNYFDAYDSRYDGNPYQGYNYAVDTHDNVTDYMKNIAHWMAWTVPQEAWWVVPQTLVAKPNTPAALPLYGNYNNWVALNGYAASDNPAPDPFVNPWYVPNITMFGFWITDPTAGGIGEHIYVTAAEAEAIYFKPMSTGDQYNGLYMQIAEPPPMPLEGEYEMPAREMGNVEIASPHADLGNLDFVGAEQIQPEPQVEAMGAGMMVMATSYSKGMEADWGIVEPKTSWRDLVDEYLLQDEEAVAAFDGAQMQKPVLVQRLDDGSSYYLVAFNKAKEGRYRRWFNRFNQKTSGVIILDAEDGHFEQAAWTAEPAKYLPVTERTAINLVWKETRKDRTTCLRKARKEYRTCRAECNGLKRKERRTCRKECRKDYTQSRKKCISSIKRPRQANLIWQAGQYSNSPFQPYWIVNMNGQEWVVTQKRQVIKVVQAVTLASVPPEPPWCKGADINKDGKVDDSDLNLLLTEFGKTNCETANNWCNWADLNGDGKVNNSDLNLFLTEFGRKNCTDGL